MASPTEPAAATAQLPQFNQEWVTNNVPSSEREWILKVVTSSFADSKNEDRLGQDFERPWINRNREEVVEQVTSATNHDRTFATTIYEVASGIRTCRLPHSLQCFLQLKASSKSDRTGILTSISFNR